MNSTIHEISPDTLNALRILADQKGKTLEEYLRSLLEHAGQDNGKNEIEKEKWLSDFDEWMENLDPQIPDLTDQQISRESIYEEQTHRQR